MRIIVRPIMEPQREVDLTHRLVSAIAEELWRLYGGNALLNWIEAERHLERIVGEARSDAREKEVVAVVPAARPAAVVEAAAAFRRQARAGRRMRTGAGATRGGRAATVLVGAAVLCAPAAAQSVASFDFDNAPLYAPLPIDVTAGGITAHLSATGQGYSIQSTSTAPVVPAGFSGRFIYPSSIYAADLLVSFSTTLTGFSILYSPQELGCDDSATMRVTAYMNGVFIGTHTTTASNPGTWPVETLAISLPQGFNSVVVHYDARPPTCQDWGPIFLADNMTVTPAPACYANCDGSTVAPVLNVNDFICFQSRFAAGDPYANCDGSTLAPALNVNDFICFQSRFAAGCP